MKIIQQNKEITWYLVDEWTTKAGLKARVHKAVLSDDIKKITTLLHDWHTGYVEFLGPYDLSEEELNKIDVHGGVTFGPKTLHRMGIEAEGRWIGFDMNHYGDENIQNLEYAKNQCEELARQINEISLPNNI